MLPSLPIASYVTTSFRVEAVTILLAIIAGSILARPKSKCWSLGRSMIGWLAARPWLCGFAVFFVSLSINASLSAIRFPFPWVHDEFSYLLASDTFSRGRLTNPSHPFWEHFETFHVLSQPTYMSKYPPANGFALGLGQLLFALPIAGAWLSLAAASAACYWMFRAWLPPRWATLGGLLVASMGSIVFSWGQTYWGGAMATLGGALTYGAIRRIWTTPRLRDSVALGVGLVILGNSRPMEGLLASLPVMVSCAIWLAHRSHGSLSKRISVALPTVVVGCFGGVTMLSYNHAVTGNAWELPYRHHDATYAASSLLIWKDPPPVPEYRHERMRSLYVKWGRERQVGMSEPARYLKSARNRLSLLWDFFSIAAGIGVVGLLMARPNRWSWLAIGVLCVILAVELQLATSQLFPHYVAPVACLFWALSLIGLRRLCVNAGRYSRRLGNGLVAAVLIVSIAKSMPWVSKWRQPGIPHPRQVVEKQLADEQGPHLVFVTYDPDYSIHAEWVYNEADIDRSRIVWARDMGNVKNSRLIDYYSDRQVWRWHLKSLDESDLSPYQTELLAESPER